MRRSLMQKLIGRTQFSNVSYINLDQNAAMHN